MVGIIGTKVNPFDALNSLLHRNNDAAVMGGQDVTYVYHNEVDQQHHEKKYAKDLRENRILFIEELNKLEYDILNQDVNAFLSMVDSETIYKIGDMNA